MSILENFDMRFAKKVISECLGCFCLTFFGCLAAVGTGGEPVATALVFGLVIISMAYTIGPISGCHINPAVSLGMLICSRIKIKDFIYYCVAQFIGATLAGLLLLGIVALTKINVAGNGFGLGDNGISLGFERSALGINAFGGIVLEIVMTFVFITVILVNTQKNSPTGDKAGIVIGVTLILLVVGGIKFTGTSVNPARSFGPALALVFTGHSQAIAQFWVFLISPLIGAALAGIFCRFFVLVDDDENIPLDNGVEAAQLEGYRPQQL